MYNYLIPGDKDGPNFPLWWKFNCKDQAKPEKDFFEKQKKSSKKCTPVLNKNL